MPCSSFVIKYGVSKAHLKSHPGYPPRAKVDEPDLSKPCAGYEPVFYESEVLQNAPWADTDPSKIDWATRKSFDGPLDFSSGGLPLNPNGRTGITGRGVLGKYGVNLVRTVHSNPHIPVTRTNPPEGRCRV
jgi:ADP-ribose pyrophosphatase